MVEQLTPSEMLKLDGMVRECVDSFVRTSAESDLRKDIASAAKDEFEVPTADFNMLVKERFKEKASEQIAKYEEIVELNDKLIDNARRTKGLGAATGE